MQLYKLAFYIVSACTVVYGYKESSTSKSEGYQLGNTPAVEMINVTKRFGKVTANDHVNL